MSIREEIAEAATTVYGVTCTPYYEQTTNPGHAFVRLERINYENAFGRVYAHPSWNVVVVLSQNMAIAERFIEDVVPALVDALKDVLIVTSAVPQRTQFPDGTTVPCVFINGHREADD